MSATSTVAAFVSVGTNIDRERNIRLALAGLRQRYTDLVCSRIYESAAVGFKGDPFYNCVVKFHTDDSAQEVWAWLREIEAQSGRDRSAPRFSSRTLDIDLLLFGQLVTAENGLQLPRDEITEHAHVLRPLAEVAGTCSHPTLGTTFQRLWSALAADAPPMTAVQFDTD